MFKFTHESSHASDTYPRKIEITINSEHVHLDELLETFNSFIKACGYYPPSDVLEYYVEDPAVEDPSVDDVFPEPGSVGKALSEIQMELPLETPQQHNE